MLSCGLTRRIRLLISKIIEKLKGKAMKKCEKISNCGLCIAKPKKSHSDLLRKQALKKLWKQNAERNGDWQRRSGISHLEENCLERENNEKIHWKHYVWTGMQNFWVDTLNCFKWKEILDLPQALFLRLSETLDWIRQNGQKQHLDEHAIEAKQSPWSDNGKCEPRREIKAEISSGLGCRNL